VQRQHIDQHVKNECTALKIKCLNCTSTLSMTEPSSDATNLQRMLHHRHFKCNAIEKTPCPTCGQDLLAKDLEKHLDQQCPERDQRCSWPFCERKHTKEHPPIPEHFRTCGECGKECNSIADVMTHLRTTCDFQISCPMGCGSKGVLLKSLDKHLDLGRAYFVVQGQALSSQGTSPGGCDKFWFPCPAGIDDGDRPKCIDFADPNRHTQDPRNCHELCKAFGRHISAAGLAGQAFIEHIQQCLKLPCPFARGEGQPLCDTKIVYGRAAEHLKTCEWVQAPCAFCGEMQYIHRAGAESRHLTLECKKFMVGCTKKWSSADAIQGFGRAPGTALRAE